MKDKRKTLSQLLLPVVLAATCLPTVLMLTSDWMLRSLASEFNSGWLNNLHFHLTGDGPPMIIFVGVLLLLAAFLCGLMLRVEGVLSLVNRMGRTDRRMMEIAVLISVLYVVCGPLYSALINLLSNGSAKLVDEEMTLTIDQRTFLAAMFAAGLAGPIAEEFLFRGAVMGVFFARGWSAPMTILASSLLFVFPHVQNEPARLISIFLGGCGFGFLRWYSGGLFAPILAHCLINGSQIILRVMLT